MKLSEISKSIAIQVVLNKTVFECVLLDVLVDVRSTVVKLQKKTVYSYRNVEWMLACRDRLVLQRCRVAVY